MNPETIEAIGHHIVTPIVIAVVVCVMGWILGKIMK